MFDVILTNPPFGGKEGKDAQKNFPFETRSTQVLFLQKILAELGSEGICGIVLDEGLLYNSNQSAFVETKRKLVDECALWCVISMPGGVFSTAGAGVKTNLLFFTKGRKTETIWYYDLSHVKVGKKTPLTLAHFGFDGNGQVLSDDLLPATLTASWQEDEANIGTPFPSYARMLALRGKAEGESRYSWSVDFAARRIRAREQIQPLLDEAAEIKAAVTDLKEEIKRLKKLKGNAAELDALQAKIRERDKAARDLENRASGIDAEVFDLKAVNPNLVTKIDGRTPAQIIQDIEAHGQIVKDALSHLSALIEADNEKAGSSGSTPMMRVASSLATDTRGR